MLDRPPSEEVTVRPARLEDAAAILELHQASIRAFGPDDYSARQVASWAEQPDGVEPYEVSIRDDTRHVVVGERGIRSERPRGASENRGPSERGEAKRRPASREDDRRESSNRASGSDRRERHASREDDRREFSERASGSDRRERHASREDDRRESSERARGSDRRERHARRNSDLVGWGRIDLNDGEVSAVYVHPDHAREGVGSKILDHLEGVAREHDIERVHLLASLNAVPFYEAAGYEALGETLQETSGGVIIECVEMEKELG